MVLILSKINDIIKLYTTRLQIVNGLNSAQATILDLKLYPFIGIILIYIVVPIKFEEEYYMDILVNVGLNINLPVVAYIYYYLAIDLY